MYSYNQPEYESDSLNGDSHVLSDLLIHSLVKEMDKPENTAKNLFWRKLHLSRAKLKASSRTSALLSGFAMVAMVEVTLSKQMPQGLLIAFSVCTTLLVAIHMLALMISTCILPNIESVASVHPSSAITESPHEKMHIYIETAWAFSTVFGILLFLSEIAILSWVKFYDYSMNAAIVSTALLVPLLFVFIGFAVHFYRSLVAHQYKSSEQRIRELESMVTHIHSVDGELRMTQEPNGLPGVHEV